MSVSSASAPLEGGIVIGLSAVVVAIHQDEAVVLTVRPPGASLEGLPFGPFDPRGHRTFDRRRHANSSPRRAMSFGSRGCRTPRHRHTRRKEPDR